MGLAASQVRFLQLTNRKASIGLELQHLSIQKMSLTRDMQKVSKNYQLATSSKTMKWSANGGVSYVDISYNGLMRPNSYNAKSPILITNSAGKVVLDEKYKKYAEMLDAAGGKWEGDVRNKILAELTGISAGDIDTAIKTEAAADSAAENYEKLSKAYEDWNNNEPKEKCSQGNFAKKIGTVNGKDLSTLYSQGANGDYKITSDKDLEILAKGIYDNMNKYFVDDETYMNVSDKTAFKKACDDFVATYSALLKTEVTNSDEARKNAGLNGTKFSTGSTIAAIVSAIGSAIPETQLSSEALGSWTIDMSRVISTILTAYSKENGSYTSDGQGEMKFPLRDTSSSAWQSWYSELKNKKAALDAAQKDYNGAVDVAAQVMTAAQETSIAYYDVLFQAIEDNGWTYDAQIGDDSEYLNEMFQNNQYYVTSIEKNACYDPSKPTNGSNWEYDYSTSTASNFENIYSVNDTDARNEALVEYEHQKSIINAKESRIDTRMKNLETEQSAINKMLESIDQVAKDNIENYYGLWA